MAAPGEENRQGCWSSLPIQNDRMPCEKPEFSTRPYRTDSMLSARIPIGAAIGALLMFSTATSNQKLRVGW